MMMLSIISLILTVSIDESQQNCIRPKHLLALCVAFFNVMLNVIMLIVVILKVIMLVVMAAAATYAILCKFCNPLSFCNCCILQFIANFTILCYLCEPFLSLQFLPFSQFFAIFEILCNFCVFSCHRHFCQFVLKCDTFPRFSRRCLFLDEKTKHFLKIFR